MKTETTGIPKLSKKPSDPSQPRIMQLAALLLDKARRERAMMCALIRPEGWVSSADAAAAHGIDQRICENYGIRAHAALATFMDMVRSAREIAAFNLSFHSFMVDIELDRLKSDPETWRRSGMKRTCVQAVASNIANSGKSMKLEAAHEAMVERPYTLRTDLLDDVRAIARIHYANQDRGF